MLLKIQSLDQIVAEAERAIGADTVLKVFGPLIEQRIEALVRAIIVAPTEELPELRGSLKEVYRMLTELRLLADRKQTVDVAFDKMFKQGANKNIKGVNEYNG